MTNKRAITSIFPIAAAVLVLNSTVLAAPTDVFGTVTDANGDPVNHASVDVLCGTTTKHANTDSNGFYTVNFGNGQCDSGQGVTVNVEKDGNTGSNNGTMGSSNVNIDVVIQAPSIPEFGLLTGIVAMSGSAGTYLLLKKRASAK